MAYRVGGQVSDDYASAVEYRAVSVEVEMYRFALQAGVPRPFRQIVSGDGEYGQAEPSARVFIRAVFFYVGEIAAVRVHVEAAGARVRRRSPRRRVSRAVGGFGFGARVEKRYDGNAVNLARPDNRTLIVLSLFAPCLIRGCYDE